MLILVNLYTCQLLKKSRAVDSLLMKTSTLLSPLQFRINQPPLWGLSCASVSLEGVYLADLSVEIELIRLFNWIQNWPGTVMILLSLVRTWKCPWASWLTSLFLLPTDRRFRTTGSRTAFESSAPPSRSAWASTNPVPAFLCLWTCCCKWNGRASLPTLAFV